MLRRHFDPQQVNQHGHPPLMIAVAQSEDDTVATLIAEGFRVDAKDKEGCTALHFAVRRSKDATYIIKELVDAGADINGTKMANAR